MLIRTIILQTKTKFLSIDGSPISSLRINAWYREKRLWSQPRSIPARKDTTTAIREASSISVTLALLDTWLICVDSIRQSERESCSIHRNLSRDTRTPSVDIWQLHPKKLLGSRKGYGLLSLCQIRSSSSSSSSSSKRSLSAPTMAQSNPFPEPSFCHHQIWFNRAINRANI
jgi:hypothetical protein